MKKWTAWMTLAGILLFLLALALPFLTVNPTGIIGGAGFPIWWFLFSEKYLWLAWLGLGFAVAGVVLWRKAGKGK